MTNSTDPFSSTVVPFQVPEQMRAFAEKGVSQAREQYAKFKDVAESHNGTVEAVLSSASKGMSSYSAKLIEFMQTNTNAAFDFAQEMVGAKSLPHAAEVWSAHTRKQFETAAAQAKELAALSQSVLTEAAEPIKAGASKIFTPAA